MQKLIAILAAAVGLVATPAFAAGNNASSKQPVPLTDRELDQVTAGNALWQVVLAPGQDLKPIIVNLTIPPNGVAIVQTNYGGNVVFSASAIGMENVFKLPPTLIPGG